MKEKASRRKLPEALWIPRSIHRKRIACEMNRDGRRQIGVTRGWESILCDCSFWDSCVRVETRFPYRISQFEMSRWLHWNFASWHGLLVHFHAHKYNCKWNRYTCFAKACKRGVCIIAQKYHKVLNIRFYYRVHGRLTPFSSYICARLINRIKGLTTECSAEKILSVIRSKTFAHSVSIQICDLNIERVKKIYR